MILVFCDVINPRIEYAIRLIFSQILGVEVILTTNWDDFEKSLLPKINYSGKKINSGFSIKPNSLMFEKGISTQQIKSVLYNGENCFFACTENVSFPFDPFAAAFYLVTRYEEYENPGGGMFGRYKADKSILSKYNLLKKPVVNIWTNFLAEKLLEYYPDLKFPMRKFRFLNTIDIDNAWAFKHKGFWRSSGAALKSVLKADWKETVLRLKVWVGKEKDPFDTYDYIDSVFKGNYEKARFFFLLGDYGAFDKNISFRNKNLRKLIQKTDQKYAVGIHPSFAAGNENGHSRTNQEISRLKNILSEKVEKSRQHYLLLRFPETYRRLLETSIQEDYTLGYAEQTGFRAGICTPFYFYDLEREETTNLLIVPFQVMDVTLRQYLGLNPHEAEEEILQLMKEVKNVDGTFVCIWHNETVSEYGHWKGFRSVFEKINKTGFAWANE